MNDNLEIVRHFYSIDDLERATEILQDAGLMPTVDEEALRSNSKDGVYALYVPEPQLEQAEKLLAQPPTEEQGAMGMFADYERESDEVREAFKQT